ncbi:MAG: molybdopterin cofactor-binding domain-containing protein, partial [Thermoanaerobaculia bacterium]
AEAAHVVEQSMYLPRLHVSSIETCGMVASYNKATEQMKIYMTSQAPHAHRTVFSMVSGLPEQKVQIISPDIGGGFGGKVPVYPGYVVCAVASLVTGAPVKWIEDRSENLQADSFARDYHITAEMAANKDGRITGLRVKTISDCGAADAAANPSKFPAGLFSICTGSYDLEAAHVVVDGVYTNKPPGGVAYRCSFRVTEAVHMIERMADLMAHEVDQDPADFRLANFIRPDQFPYKSPTGWEYDSGNYKGALDKAMEMLDYRALREEQAAKRERGELMGIGISSFTEVVGAGPSRDFDILGIKMFDSAEIRIHPTGKAIARFGTKSQGQGHETTYAQIVAEELGLPAADIQVEEGDTDTAPYGLGTYASRSTPTAGAAGAMAARKIKAKAKKIAAYLLEVGEDDLDWSVDRWQVKGSPDQAKTIQEIAFAAYTNHPPGMEAGLEATDYYDPPNLTFPFGSYIAVVDIDTGTGEVAVRRFVAVDDCGNIINPMIVEGQIEGGLTMGLAPALYEEIVYDENGQNLTGTFADYLLPTAVESPKWELGKTITPSPHHPLGAKGVGESPTVGAPPAIVNAVVDALWHLGVRHLEIPITPEKVWTALREAGVND